MKKRLALILSILGAISFFAYQRAAESKPNELPNAATQIFSEIKPQTVKAAAFGVSGKVSDIAPAEKRANSPVQTRALFGKENFRSSAPTAVHDADASLARVSDLAMPNPTLSFDGISNYDNYSAYGFAVVPPDANGDVGPNHFVQSVNILSRVFDKNGAPLTAPFKLSDIFRALGTPCSEEDSGSPTALYDALADRWLLSQYCTLAPPFRQMIAVSKTSDPTGEYYVYEFVMPNFKLNDYSKFGVWTDGYYMATDQFIGSDFAGNGVFAFDKKKMLAGDPTASFVYFDLPAASTVRFGGFLPSDFDGLNAPPANAPNVFMSYTATEYGAAADALRLFDFRADFANPQNSTFVERAESPLPVAAFDPTSPEGRSDIAEPPPGELLDSQSDRLMYRLAYRNLGATAGESLVVNQTVRMTPPGQTYRAGVRVYELRKQNGAYAVREQATVGDTNFSRWMGSAAQDWQGNLAVGYSFTSELKKPAILYSGKLASEPAGAFRQEATLISGTGVQAGFGSRWGDYSQMTVDPSDDCTFWLTNEYYTTESQAVDPLNWLTRIGKFKFDECRAAPRATISGRVINAASGQPVIYEATVTANQVYTRNVDSTTGNYGTLMLVPNTYVLTATARGFRSQTVTVTLADGQNLTQNFALQPIAVFERATVNIRTESCAVNNAIEPSETVSADIALVNEGAANTTNLVVTLLPTGGVMNPSQPQNYGSVGGSQILRPFGFTASPNLSCGDPLTLTFQLQDGAENLGTVTAQLRAGKPRTAFTENFGVTGEPNLPPGWTTSASGAQPVWKTSMTQYQTPPLAAYSAAAAQAGVNELTSPTIHIRSPQAELSFRNRYDLETTFLRNKLYDGAVLEIKIGDGFFQDILAAGGTFVSSGYDGVLESCCQNPLAGRLAWSGKSGVNQTPQFITSTVKLPARAADKNVRFRWRVGTDQGTSREGQYIDDVYVSDGFECDCQNAQLKRAPFDFDGDGKTDLSHFIPRLNPNTPDFYIQNSSDNSTATVTWGTVFDEPVNADYDGDGKTDYAVFRPSTGTWFVLRSSDNAVSVVNFGLATDRWTPADYDGDGKADIAVFRPSSGAWYILQSSNGQMRSVQFGASEDLPVQADFDGDSKTDVAVFRSSNGVWYFMQSSDGALKSVQFGQSGDKPVVGDYDGDSKADFVVFRPPTGVWYLQRSTQAFAAVQFGASVDKALQADFDGDGKRDVAVYRQSTGIWFYLKSSDGAFVARQFGFGSSADVPLPNIFVP